MTLIIIVTCDQNGDIHPETMAWMEKEFPDIDTGCPNSIMDAESGQVEYALHYDDEGDNGYLKACHDWLSEYGDECPGLVDFWLNLNNN